MRRKSIIIGVLIMLAGALAIVVGSPQPVLPEFSQTHVRIEYLSGESIRYEYLDAQGQISAARIIYPDGSEEDVFYADSGSLKQRVLLSPNASDSGKSAIERVTDFDQSGSITNDHVYRQDGSISLIGKRLSDLTYEVKQFDRQQNMVEYELFHSSTDDRLLLQRLWRSDGTLLSEAHENQVGSLVRTEFAPDGTTKIHSNTTSTTGKKTADTTYYPDTGTPEYVWSQSSFSILGQFFRKDGTLAEDRTVASAGDLIETFYNSAGVTTLRLTYSQVYSFGTAGSVAVSYKLSSADVFAVIEQGKEPEVITTTHFADDGKTPTVEYDKYDPGTHTRVQLVKRFRADGTLESVQNEADGTTVNHSSAENIRLAVPESWLVPSQSFAAMPPVDMPPRPSGPDDY